MTPLLHFISGSIGLLGGALAYSTLKGGTWHRRSGTAYCIAMLAMGASGSALAWVHAKPLSLLSGLLVCYLVITGWMTVRQPVGALRGWLILGMVAAMCIGLSLLALAMGVITPRPGDAGPSLVFGLVALTAAALDARLLAVGRISGSHRLARHLWRLGFALLMATAAFFLGQAKLFPLPIRKFEWLGLPVVAVLGFTVFFGVRVWLRSRRAAAAA